MSTSSEFNSALYAARTPRRVSHAKAATRVFSVILMAVFFVLLMIGLVSGAVMYRSIAATQSRSNDLVMEAGLLESLVHGGDSRNAVRQGAGPEGPALVFVEEVGADSYETRLYLHQGTIVEEYALAGKPYEPANANELLSAEEFDFTVEEGHLTLFIDDTAMTLYLRSDQDGAAPALALDAAGRTAGEEIIEGAPSKRKEVR